MGKIMKMRIQGFSDAKFKTKVGYYDAMINPDSIKLERSIEYNTEQAPDQSQSAIKYKKTPGSILSFDLTLDCTGVVDPKRIDLPEEIKQLQDVVYN